MNQPDFSERQRKFMTFRWVFVSVQLLLGTLAYIAVIITSDISYGSFQPTDLIAISPLILGLALEVNMIRRSREQRTNPTPKTDFNLRLLSWLGVSTVTLLGSLLTSWQTNLHPEQTSYALGTGLLLALFVAESAFTFWPVRAKLSA